MPKTDVDIVDLIAINELSPAVGMDNTWNLPVSSPGLAQKIANRATIEELGNVISEQIGSGQVIPDRVYTIGGEMHGSTIANGSDLGFTGTNNVIQDPYLDGKDWSLFLIGVGYMEKGSRWQNDIVGGGFRLTQVGDEFGDGTQYALIFKPQFSSVIVTPDAVARFTSGEQIVTANTAAGPSLDRKLILIQGATSAAVTYTLNPAYPENVMCVIETGGGSNFQSIVQPPAGQTMWRGGTITSHILGQIDYIALVRIGTVWRVVFAGERWKHVGEGVYGGLPGPDRLSANGQVLQRSSFPGVDLFLDQYQVALPGSVITTGTWNSSPQNQGKWARDATTIIVPRIGGRFIRALDLGSGFDPDRVSAGTASIPASFEAQSIESHSHPLDGRLLTEGVAGSGPGGITSGTSGVIPTTGTTGSTETRPDNIALPFYFLI